MSNDLTKVEPAAVAVVQGHATTLLTAIAAAASNPAADIDKMERLFAMHEQMVKRESEMVFNAAFSRAQAKMPIVAHNAVNNQTSSRYAKLAAINHAITPIYTAEGLAVSFDNADSPKPEHIRVLATLSHAQGHSRQYHIDMPLDDKGIKGTANKTEVHATGSTNAYARRYLVLMIFNLSTADEDTDAQRKRATPNAGAGDDLDEAQKARVHEVAEKVHQWLETGSIADAYQTLDQANFDVEEKRYAWTMFDAKARKALKDEGERLRRVFPPQVPPAEVAPDLISDSQRKRLEARIGELSADRDEVKAHVLAKFKKAHFSELTKAEYATLDAELHDFAPASSAPLSLSSGESIPPATLLATGQAGGADSSVSQEMVARGYASDFITEDQCMTLETLLKDVGVTAYALKKAAKVETLYEIKAADYDRTLEWIDKKSQQINS